MGGFWEHTGALAMAVNKVPIAAKSASLHNETTPLKPHSTVQRVRKLREIKEGVDVRLDAATSSSALTGVEDPQRGNVSQVHQASARDAFKLQFDSGHCGADCKRLFFQGHPLVRGILKTVGGLTVQVAPGRWRGRAQEV
eukprot:1689778-Rhodomonas_salina.4